MVSSDAPSASRISMAATPVRSLPAEQWNRMGVSPASSARNSSLNALLPVSIRRYITRGTSYPSGAEAISLSMSPGAKAISCPSSAHRAQICTSLAPSGT